MGNISSCCDKPKQIKNDKIEDNVTILNYNMSKILAEINSKVFYKNY